MHYFANVFTVIIVLPLLVREIYEALVEQLKEMLGEEESSKSTDLDLEVLGAIVGGTLTLKERKEEDKFFSQIEGL